MGSANLGSQEGSMGAKIAADGDGQVDSSKDTIFMILRSSRRRLLLHYLERSGGSRSRGELARYVAAAEEGVEMSQVTTTDRKRVYVSLHQTHLPTMDDVGIIDYDKDRGTVELCEEEAQNYYRYLHFDPDSVSSTPTELERNGDDRVEAETDDADGTRRELGSTRESSESVDGDADQQGMVQTLFGFFKTT